MNKQENSKKADSSNELYTVLSTGGKEELLKNFIEEFFDYNELQKVGFWKGISKTDYKAQAERICKYFGLNTIYEYGAEPMKAHLTYAKRHRPKDEPFVTEFPSIYE
jgi:hypothetical protein